MPAAPPEQSYPSTMTPRAVSSCGTLRYQGYQRHVSTALAGHMVGVEPLPDARFRVWFADTCIGEANLPWVTPLIPCNEPEEAPATPQNPPSDVTPET